MFRYIGAAVGKCAETLGCGQAPDVICKQLHLEKAWYKTVYFLEQKRKLEALQPLAVFSNQLAKTTCDVLNSNQKFITFGGDHSCAIGTWSAVAEHYGEFGLIWIDAHMDAHTPQTSSSGNPHGMPVAVLLGQGDHQLTSVLCDRPKLAPENIVIIGVRSYEPEEKLLLDRLGVRVYDMDQVMQYGFAACFQQAIDDFTQRGLDYGISFDLDGLDPQDMTSFGTPVENGLRLKDVLPVLDRLDLERLIGVEIAEYNPTLDKNHHDLQVIEKILACFLRQ